MRQPQAKFFDFLPHAMESFGASQIIIWVRQSTPGPLLNLPPFGANYDVCYCHSPIDQSIIENISWRQSQTNAPYTFTFNPFGIILTVHTLKSIKKWLKFMKMFPFLRKPMLFFKTKFHKKYKDFPRTFVSILHCKAVLSSGEHISNYLDYVYKQNLSSSYPYPLKISPFINVFDVILPVKMILKQKIMQLC